MSGKSLLKLVKKHGMPLHVKCIDPSVLPFEILAEKGRFYEVRYKDGRVLEVLKSHPGCNDYVLNDEFAR